ncbi:hypothetical protein GQ53DRAFT_756571 [Thozetella sp. PMI_491]|nr:hypothetical protein GQ53DRAFT_756571 [Thozetella sp. PMI_491]
MRNLLTGVSAGTTNARYIEMPFYMTWRDAGGKGGYNHRLTPSKRMSGPGYDPGPGGWRLAPMNSQAPKATNPT